MIQAINFNKMQKTQPKQKEAINSKPSQDKLSYTQWFESLSPAEKQEEKLRILDSNYTNYFNTLKACLETNLKEIKNNTYPGKESVQTEKRNDDIKAEYSRYGREIALLSTQYTKDALKIIEQYTSKAPGAAKIDILT